MRPSESSAPLATLLPAQALSPPRGCLPHRLPQWVPVSFRHLRGWVSQVGYCCLHFSQCPALGAGEAGSPFLCLPSPCPGPHSLAAQQPLPWRRPQCPVSVQGNRHAGRAAVLFLGCSGAELQDALAEGAVVAGVRLSPTGRAPRPGEAGRRGRSGAGTERRGPEGSSQVSEIRDRFHPPHPPFHAWGHPPEPEPP